MKTIQNPYNGMLRRRIEMLFAGRYEIVFSKTKICLAGVEERAENIIIDENRPIGSAFPKSDR